MKYKKLHPNILLMTLFCLFMINKSNAQNYNIIEPGPEHYASKASSSKNSTTPITPIIKANTNNPELLNKAFNLSSKSNTVVAQSTAVNCYIPPDATYTNFPGNDDASVGPIALPFAFSLYGINYTSVYINNNGNLTFTAPSSSFDPVGFPTSTPMVAPFWADVDTRVGNTVKYKVSPTRLIVTWPGVGYYNQNVSKLNTFQVVITNGNDPLIGLGNNVAFYYGDMQWTTGEVASNGGVGGFGGVPATAGINQGDGVNYIQIGRFNQNNANYGGPLSGTSGINYLDLGCYPLTAGSLTNLQPAVSGIPANNTLNIACGETGTINLTAFPPEVGQNVSVAIDTGTLCNATIVNATTGTSSNATVSIVGGACNQGSHNISFVFTDNFNPSASTTVNITVVIGTAPVITCPSNITVSNTSGLCGAQVFYPAATATGTSPTITYSIASGSIFPVGTTTVTTTATNACGTDTCTFEVTVNDTEPPAITCPANITVSNTTGQCGALVSWSADPIIDQQQTNAGAATYGSVQWQSFTAGIAGQLTKVELHTNGFSSGTQPYTFTIREGQGTGGTLLYSGSGSFDTPFGNWFSLDIPQGSQPLLVAGNQYTVQINITGSYNQLSNSNTNPYAGGIYYSDAYGTQANWDLRFRTYISTNGATDNCGIPTVSYSPASGSFFAKGTTTVTGTATDGAGNTTQCTFTVTVNDTQAPTITCPANIEGVVATSASGAVVNYTTPVGTDNCTGATTTRTEGLASGATFPIGTTTVTHLVTDAADLTAQCSFTVTVIGVAPEITCPANITVNNTSGLCGANVSFAATSTGTPTPTITYSHASGSQFPIGTTTVTATSTNSVGSDSCTFEVIVNDTQPPSITCPANIVVSNDANQCGANVTFTATATDNCGTANITYSPASGSTFSVGTTTVTATANDDHGNTASCTFTVTVNDTQAPNAICQNVTIQLNSAGIASTNASAINNGSNDNCGIASLSATNTTFSCSDLTLVRSFDCTQFNAPASSDQTGYARLSNPLWTGNINGNFTLSATLNGVTVSAIPTGVGNGQYRDRGTAGLGSFSNRELLRDFIGNDGAAASITIEISGLLAGTHNINSFHHDWNVWNPARDFSIYVDDAAGTNQPKVVGAFFSSSVNPYNGESYNIQSDGINIVKIYVQAGSTNQARFNGLKITPVSITTPVNLNSVLTVTDIYGNSSSCNSIVTVQDNINPVVTCPANIIVNNTTGSCGTTVTYAATATDNCSVSGITYSPASGSFFAVGTTSVTATATDVYGNSSSCSFDVIVNDTEAPVITCPANIVVSNDANQCGANVTFAATATDNCGTANITYSPVSGSFFAVGTTPVTATANDGNGNTTSCTFTVTVNDTQPPVINCPANIDVDLSAGQCGAFVSFAATASDNCGTANITYSHAPGSLFNVGTTTVTATANDGNGNTASCTFTVTVDLLDHVNLQWPPDATICPGGSFTAYGQVYEPNVTTVPGSQGANIEVQFGYNTTNTNPSGWSNWFTASYNQDFNGNPNNDEYYYNFSSNIPGTYYYTFRYRQNGCDWQYGGFRQWDGGTWDGTNNVSGVLTVQSLDWANLQWPPSATICQGSSFVAYGQVYEAGVTTVPGVRGAGIDVQFGYNTANTNPSGWSNWTTLNSANFNALGGGPANDEYFYNFTPPTSGTFYYTFRYRLNGCAWQYGGFSNGGGLFWDGNNFVSGVANVSPTTVAGNVNGGTSICPGETSALLTLSGYTGDIMGWESTTSPFLSWDPISNNNPTYVSGPLSETTKFRAIVQSGVCPSQTSGETTVIVYLTYPFYADNDDDGYGAGPVAYLCSDAANNPPDGYSVDGTDCDDTKGDRHQTFPFYVDADGDGFGAEDSTAVELCAVDGNTPPQPNYSVNDDDCNDLVFAINPSVAEIPFDNIDNNCNGSLYDGHPLIIVNVLSPSCGGINHGLNNTINCTEIYLGEGYVIGYRFKVTNLSTGEVDYVDRIQHHFKLTETDIYAYGTSYSIQVAAIVNGEVQGYNGAVCTLTTTNVATTKVINSQCGSTLLFMNSTINANSVNSAITYRFRVARADAPTTYYYSGERNLPNFNLTMLTVPVGFLTYATEYKVDVQIKIKLANIIAWSQFGQVCSIFTPTPPTSSVIASQCELIATSNTQVINATPFAGATLYRFLLTHYDEFGEIDYQQYQDTPTPSFTLSMFTGLLPSTTYNVSVSMQFYGTFVPYDKDCIVTTPAFTKAVVEIPFKATVYPNPYTENFMIDVKTSSTAVINIKVYDMIGRLVEQKAVKANDLSNAPIGERYPSGVYNVVVSQDDEVSTLRVVKR